MSESVGERAWERASVCGRECVCERVGKSVLERECIGERVLETERVSGRV